MTNEVPPKTKVPVPEISIDERGLERLSEEERKLFRLLVPGYKRSAIPLSKFEGLYDEGMIARDQNYVDKMEIGFQTGETDEQLPSKRRGELLEGLTKEQIKHNNWLGREAVPVTASRYDDIANGVDLIIEFLKKEGIQRLVLSIDVTSNTKSLEEKLRKIKDDILMDRLTRVKYFISSDGNRQEITSAPRVIIGTEAETIRELSLLRLEVHTYVKSLQNNRSFLSTESVQSLETRMKEAKFKLARHRIQILILDEIEKQVKVFMEFARRNQKPIIVQEYERTLKVIRGIRDQKSIPGGQRSISLSDQERADNANDGVYKALESGLAIFS